MYLFEVLILHSKTVIGNYSNYWRKTISRPFFFIKNILTLAKIIILKKRADKEIVQFQIIKKTSTWVCKVHEVLCS